MTTNFPNVPAIWANKGDGGLVVLDSTDGKRVIIYGTASKGPGMEPYRVTSLREAKVLFGTSGSLIRGLYQVNASGFTNIWVFRIGAEPAVIEGIGAGDSYSVVSVEEDADVNSYQLAYYPGGSDASKLIVWDGDPADADTTKVYDSYAGINTGKVEVSGNALGGTAIGSVVTPTGVSFTTLYADYIGAGTYGLTYVTLGTDGVVTDAPKYKMYEYLYNAFELSIGLRFERVVAMDVYADDYSIAFFPTDTGTTYAVEGVTIRDETDPLYSAATDGMLPAALRDYVLGWLHVYKNEDGRNIFTWAWDLNEDGDHGWVETNFSIDRLADQPAIADGDAITYTGDEVGFHEVDFAYLLANFCYIQSFNDHECSAVIGTNPPPSYSMRSVYKWIGKLPTYDPTDTVLPYDVTTDGSGLCGMPYTVGCLQASRNVFGRTSGATTFYPGYFATDTGYPDGGVLTDFNDYNIDIGKYLDIIAVWPKYYTAWDRSQLGYSDSAAAWYAGFQLIRPSKETPTNKLISKNVALPHNVSKQQLNDLVTARTVFFQRKDKGTVVCSACTAATLKSDFVRRGGTAIVQDVITDIREVGDPYLGNSFTKIEQLSLDTAITSRLNTRKENGFLNWFNFTITTDVIRGTLGSATIELQLDVANELGRITINVGLTRSDTENL